ncbi:hypothetical protein QZH41_004017 [Actinostola sp. cb2023]|nr:hypothetical protein QZH41_004017 [Actinostola sp. cb2023]
MVMMRVGITLINGHDEVPEYDVTHPYQSTPEGKFVSHDLRSNHRIIRNADSSDEHHYSLKAFGKTLHLNLRENKDLIAPGLMLESYADGKVKRTPLEPTTHYIGRVRDYPESTVAISNHGALHHYNTNIDAMRQG